MIIAVYRTFPARASRVSPGRGGIRTGRDKPASRKAANRAHPKLRAPGERANVQLRTRRILLKLRCCPWKAGLLAKAIHVPQVREMQGWADPPLTPAGLGEGSIADAHNLRIPITLHGISGLIAVSITRSTDPDALGYLLLTGGQPTDAACGFPVCRATVTYPAEGYAAMFGWTQMVRSTDSDPDRFEMDPIALYRQVLTPYAFFGVRPELFDAPSRDSKYDMDWLAHSFLCVSPDAVLTRHVQAVAGFSWGFTITRRTITFARPAALGPETCDSHLDLLKTSYPGWIFDSEYLSA